MLGAGRQPSTQQPVVAEAVEAGDDEAVAEGLSKEVFATYVCRSVNHPLAKDHPGDIAEASSLSAIRLPDTNYPLYDALPEEVIASGKLSKLQLEGVLYACSMHQAILPNGERAGFFVGDGAGVGKGRQIAGVILDNLARGRRRHVWLSTSSDLHLDAQRDFRDLGCHVNVINNCQTLDREHKALGLSKDFQEGVLFMTYSTLIAGGKGKARIEQVIDWLGPDFDGCLVFDECHKAKNYVPGNESQSTKVSACVIDLQQRLPLARVLYCSATGVSEVGNMAYMTRMGLWGPGTAFDGFEQFLDSMKKRGVSFLEMLAMEMKAEGKYVARGLSFRDTEFAEDEAPLTQRQLKAYDESVALWQSLRGKLEMAHQLVGIQSKEVWKSFWSAQQRFFKLLCVSLKVPFVVEQAKAALEAGQCMVIGLQSTGEAAAEAMGLKPGPAPFVSTTRELLLRFVETHFPVQLPVSAEAAAAGVRPDNIPACVHMKQELLAAIRALHLPMNFLDQLIDELGGVEQVAEMTGRQGRVVRDARGRSHFELRAKPDSTEMDSLNVREKDAFMRGHKLIAIISDAASTGISLHADRRAPNQRRRVHMTIELPWSADKAIQQLGRSHRSNQTSAPIYKLIASKVGGEKRFAAAVARRLQSLGALTRGDRRAASGIDLSDSNFDSPWGRKSLRKMYDMIVGEASNLPSGVKLASLYRDANAETRAALQSFLANHATHSPCEAAASPDAKATASPAPAPSPSPGPSSAATASNSAAASAGDEGDRVLNSFEVLLRDAPAEAFAQKVLELHHDFRQDVGLMGIGLTSARKDTVAEERLKDAGVAIGKDLGDVRRFLNRILCLPVTRQNLLFNYFAATLTAEIAAAKAEGRYNEGVSDLHGSHIRRSGDAEVLSAVGNDALPTLHNTLLVDRGVRFQDAQRRLQHESVPGDHSGFRRSRRPMFGVHRVLLALQKPGQKNLFVIVRPNTGESYLDMERSELEIKYGRAEEESVEADWAQQYEDSLKCCMHGPSCQHGGACQVGRRETEVHILSGSVVRVWGVLELVLERHQHDLHRSDKVMRVVRVAFGDGSHLVGVRYPPQLLKEVAATLASLRAATTANTAAATAGGSGNAAAGAIAAAAAVAAGGAELGGAAGAGPRGGAAVARVEAVTPVDQKSLAKALRAPKTLMDFFKPHADAAAGQAPQHAAAAKGKANAAKQQQQKLSMPKVQAQPQVQQEKPKAGGSSGQQQCKRPASELKSQGPVPKKQQTQQQQEQQPAESESVIIIDTDDAPESGQDRRSASGRPAGVVKQATHAQHRPAAEQQQQHSQQRDAVLPVEEAQPVAKRQKSADDSCSMPSSVPSATAGQGWHDEQQAKPQPAKGATLGNGAAIARIMGMGFSQQQAERALWAAKGNVDRAIDFILSTS